MSPSFNSTRTLTLLATVMLVGCSSHFLDSPVDTEPSSARYQYPGKITHETQSAYSHIRLRDQGRIRTMVFVESNGGEVRQTSIKLTQPQRLLVPYTQHMFASLLLSPNPERVLIIGMGGGSMIHFLDHHFPGTQIEAVEIDPEVVKIAHRWFNVPHRPTIGILQEDAFEYIKHDRNPFDVIFMDAFLKPGEATGAEGVPLTLKTKRFLRQLSQKLAPNGVVAFNLVHSDETAEDLKLIGSVFPQRYCFRVPDSRNYVILATHSKTRFSQRALTQRARSVDEQLDTNFTLREILSTLVRAEDLLLQ